MSTSTEATGESGTLLNGLQEEAAIYRKVLDDSAEELRLVKSAELEKATASLSRKQQHLEEIAAVERRIKPLKDRWPEIKSGLATGAFSAFQSTLKDLSDLLEQLIAIERETEEILSQQIAVVRKGVGAAVTEEQARKAYGAKQPNKN